MNAISLVCAVAIAVGSVGAAEAQAPAAPMSQFDSLRGAWVRPDGGYTIVIKSASPDGRLDATYYNPNALPFAKAQASKDGAKLAVSLELRAGGYDGSTYALTYDPASDQLKGNYYQAVAKQSFSVYFVRAAKP